MRTYVFHKINYKDLHIIIENLYNLYKSSIPIINSFELLEELPLGKLYRESIPKIREILQDGGSLHYAFNEYKELYPKFFLAMLKIGEDTGRLGDVLYGLEVYYKKIDIMKKRVSNILIYPVILIILTILLVIFLLLFVLPTFSDVFTSMQEEIPKVLKMTIMLNRYIKKAPVIALVSGVIWFVAIPLMVIRYNITKINKIISKVPLYKKVKEYIAIVLLSIIVKSGISLSTGLQYCSESELVGGIVEGFNTINLEVMEGKTLALAIEKSKLVSKFSLAHVKLGEECGNLDEVLINLEKDLFEKLTLEINRSIEFISPMTIIVIGGVILSFILIFILPIFDGLLG